MTAVTMAARRDEIVGGVVGRRRELDLVLAAVSAGRDILLMFGLGRTSRRVHRENGISRWVCANVVHRPGLVLVGARFLPAGRLVSTVAAGRYGVPVRRFLPWSFASSVIWSGYILAVGLLLGPLTHGDPLRSLLAGIAMAALMAGGFSLARRVRRALSPPSEAVAVPSLA